ncbi:ABC transporter permease [Tissierella carlieri]|uniref:Transport permease protein n=1 Tax=Tissierella carlieri TaxID=689904 RepID=A0ABT1SCV8_9FIRM|nr:ABC transporter permease [Tissierella carlieri]MCQ4924327.1 ABC transporter permease [Tissierella carlieri]
MSVFTILQRNIKWRFHNAFTIVITILQPILWLILYSAVAGQTMKNTGIENYTAFILPGLVVLVSFSTCSSSGIMNYMMKSEGSFYRVLIAPVRRSSIVLGQLLEAVLCTFLEVGIMGIFSLLFSVKVATGLTGILFILLLVFLTAFFMAGLSYAISLILPNEVVYETVMNAIVLPIFFLSTALFPVNEIKGIFAIAIKLNPFTHVIDALRSLILYGNIEPARIFYILLLFAIMCGISFLWALHRLKRETSL